MSDKAISHVNKSTSEIREKKKKTLSLCMIVKDEERFIRKCLSSVCNAVDEIIIVDTGSTDATKEICKEFGATVLDYPWNNDFAAARNYGLRHASGDWILWLDADEFVESQDLPELQKAIETVTHKFLTIHLINFSGETPNVDESFQIAHVKLFQNHAGIEFEGRIHEHLNIQNTEEIVDIPIRIYHYGYMKDIMNQKQKPVRNIRILEEELQKQDHSPWLHYHIASEYFNLHRHEEAFNQVNVAIVQFLLQGQKPPALIYHLKYLILLNYGSADGALAGIDKAIEMYPDYVDLHFFKGFGLYAKEQYREAMNTFHHCITLGERNRRYLTMRGVGSFQAWYYIGKCHEMMGHNEDAQHAYLNSLAISPLYSPSIEALNRESTSKLQGKSDD